MISVEAIDGLEESIWPSRNLSGAGLLFVLANGKVHIHSIEKPRKSLVIT